LTDVFSVALISGANADHKVVHIVGLEDHFPALDALRDRFGTVTSAPDY
jgi:hypothetical protein